MDNKYYEKIIDDIHEFRDLEADWNRLLSESDTDSIFLTWEWLYTWWETYSYKNQLYIILLCEGNMKIVGAAPFYFAYEKIYGKSMRVIKFISSGEVCSEYLDIIIQNDNKENIKSAFVQIIKKELLGSNNVFIFESVCDNSNLYECLKKLGKSIIINSPENDCTINPYIMLPESEKDFLSKISNNTRRAIKKKKNKLDREHGYNIIGLNEINDMEKALDIFMSLHQKSWNERGHPGVFNNHDICNFHKNVATRFEKNGWLRLYFISIKGSMVASLYGFQYNEKFYAYQSGFDPNWKVYGLGKILIYHSIHNAMRNNIKEYDFLRGEEEYKGDFTDVFRNTRKYIVLKYSYAIKFIFCIKYLLNQIKYYIKKGLYQTFVDG